MNLQVTFSANAGVSLQFRSAKIWVDALHNTSVAGFSTLDADKLEQMKQQNAFQSPDAIIYTHCHPDHYSRILTEETLLRWPQTRLILPEPEFPQAEVLYGELVEKWVGNVKLRLMRLPHEKECYSTVPHYGLLLQEDDFTVLIPGDCALESSALQTLVGNCHIDVAWLNFPWITLRHGREFLLNEIRPEHLLVCHLPFEEDDMGGYRAAAKTCGHYLWDTDIRYMEKFLQQEQI